jgi:hypothetical protein
LLKYNDTHGYPQEFWCAIIGPLQLTFTNDHDPINNNAPIIINIICFSTDRKKYPIIPLHCSFLHFSFHLQMETLKSTISEQLQGFYSITDPNLIPPDRYKSEWKNDNKFGFFKRIIHYGEEDHIQEIGESLSNGTFSNIEAQLIDRLYDYYIRPFKQQNGSSRSTTPTSLTISREIGASRANTPPSRSSTPTSSSNGDQQVRPLRYKDFVEALSARDGVCLMCWSIRRLEAGHIIAKKNDLIVAVNETSILERAGLYDKHQVQNGLLLCATCHKEFDALKYYVDVVNDNFVFKVVNPTNDDNDPRWKATVEEIQDNRAPKEKQWIGVDNRKATDSMGEMLVYFVKHDPSIQPNKMALNFHKIACLIWRSAGGAETEEESFDHDQDIDAIRVSIEKVRNWVSSETLLNFEST